MSKGSQCWLPENSQSLQRLAQKQMFWQIAALVVAAPIAAEACFVASCLL